jgi:Tfp pilus assembly major pilin PilA
MKKRNKTILGAVIVIVIAAIVIPMYMSRQHTTFRAEVTDHMSMLDTLDRLVIKKIAANSPYDDEGEVTIKDPNEIRAMLKQVKDIEFKRVQENDISKGSRSPYYFEWRLTIKKEDRFTESFGITFYNEHAVSIYSEYKTRDQLENYEITNDFNLNELERLFTNLKEGKE